MFRSTGLGTAILSIDPGKVEIARKFKSVGIIDPGFRRSFDEAIDVYGEAPEIQERALGPDHPYVADDLEEFAKLRREMGMDAAADELEARVKAIRGD